MIIDLTPEVDRILTKAGIQKSLVQEINLSVVGRQDRLVTLSVRVLKLDENGKTVAAEGGTGPETEILTTVVKID